MNKKAEYQKEIDYFTADDQKLLDYGGQLEKLVKECKLYQEAKEKILAFDELLKCEGLLSTLSDEPPGHRRPGSATEAISELIRQAQVKRTEAELAKEELEKEILPALDFVESRRDQVTLEISMLEQRLIELGKGDLAEGVRLFEEIKQVLKELREVEVKLEELRPGQVPGSLAEALKLEQKLGQEISDLKIYIDLKNKQTELAEITSDLNNWADLPDYQEFMAAKKTEMDEIESELSVLRSREAEILAVIQSPSQEDRVVLGLTEKVEKMAQELFHYQEGQKKQLLLQTEADRHTRRLESLAAEVWPGGWKEDYSNIVLGLDIDEVDRELDRYSRFNLERDRAEESLANYEIKEARPGLALWLGGVLATIGLVVILTTQSNLGYLALPAGMVALAAGYRRFKKDRERLAGQEKYRKMLQQVLLRATDSLEKSKARLTQKLEGLPVPLESFTASTGAWVSLVRELQSVCRERRRCQEELAGLRQGVMEWESALKEVAAALPAPLLKAPEQVVVEFTERVRQAGLRAKEADAAREVLEKEILPAVCSAESRRAQLEREINEVEQRFMELGKGDLAAGVQLIQEKKQAQQDLKEVEAKLEGLSFGQAGGSLDEVARLEGKLVQYINNLGIYINLKNRQIELEKKYAFPCTWGDLPDYLELMAGKKTELDSLKRELESLKEREKHKLTLAGSYSPFDQKILELAEKIDISELSALKKLMDNWEENFREVATSLSVPVAGSLEETLSGLVRQLKQAEGRKAAALAAQEALVMGVHPALDEAEIRLAQVEREIAALREEAGRLNRESSEPCA
ncbi:MAG: hypothetical protein K6U74_08120 [Firmicutes bacterium]|nr:hypothetical protein [Bacillota bacterium]